LTLVQFKRQLGQIGLALAGQTADLAPADGQLYALRDVTGTVDSMPLIASSIMSKKLAGGADAIVLDVKTGSGAFMPTVAAARELAQIMVDIGNDAGRKTVALISDMNQPLGHAVGNALEVKEAIVTLQGQGPVDFWTHCLEVAGHMILLAGKASTLAEAKVMATAVRDGGQAWAKFRAMVQAQGGDVRQLDDPGLLPQASLIEPITAPGDCVIAAMDTGAIGWAIVHLGGGRLVKTDKIDHAVGLVMPHKVGDQLQTGQTLGFIHANDATRLSRACQEISAAITWTQKPTPPLPHFYGTIE
jgi:pyrimidine-nucleoside phosphorylase